LRSFCPVWLCYVYPECTSIDSLSSEAEWSWKPNYLQTIGVGPLGQGSKDVVEQLEAFTATTYTHSFNR